MWPLSMVSLHHPALQHSTVSAVVRTQVQADKGKAVAMVAMFTGQFTLLVH
jgi:hypothetical protein